MHGKLCIEKWVNSIKVGYKKKNLGNQSIPYVKNIPLFKLYSIFIIPFLRKKNEGIQVIGYFLMHYTPGMDTFEWKKNLDTQLK